MSTLEKFFANLPDCGCDHLRDTQVASTQAGDPLFAKIDRALSAVPNSSEIPQEGSGKQPDDAVAKRVREIFSDEKVERELYVEAIAKGLETPYVMFDQPDANKPLLAGNWRITVNVPSVIPGAAVAATFGAATAREYAIEAFRRNPKLTDTFLSFLRTQLPAEAWWDLERTADVFVPLLQQHPEYSMETIRRMTRETLRSGRKSDGNGEETEPKPSYMPDKWPCGVEYPQMRNPSWYLGFVRDSNMTIEGVSRYESPTGKVIFGNRSQVSIAIPLPGRWPLRHSIPPGATHSVNRIAYHFAIRIHDGVNPSGLDSIEEMAETTRLLGPLLFTLFFYYQSETDDWTGESVSFQGVLMIFNSDVWMCKLEYIERYKPHDNVPDNPDENWDEWRSFNTNIFDDISLEANRRFDFHTIVAPIRIYSIYIENNAVTILNRPRTSIELLPRGETARVKLLLAIMDFKRQAIEPDGYFRTLSDHMFTAEHMVELARVNPIIAQASQELGQAWSQKYGGEWFYNPDPTIANVGWLSGPFSWCSESSMWFIREANRRDPILDLSDHREFYAGTDIGLTNWIRWFLCRGRYISGRTARWKDLVLLVKPGYWVSVKDNGHAVIFLYWTRPPQVDFPLDPGYPPPEESKNRRGNDPLNDLHSSWDVTAAEFDPNAKVNRFRCIAGNEGARVRISNYSLVRVANQKELDAWRYDLRATRMKYDPAGEKILSIEYEQLDDNETQHFLFWREGDDLMGGDDDFCKQYLQDGFGQTDGFSDYVRSPENCERLGI